MSAALRGLFRGCFVTSALRRLEKPERRGYLADHFVELLSDPGHLLRPVVRSCLWADYGRFSGGHRCGCARALMEAARAIEQAGYSWEKPPYERCKSTSPLHTGRPSGVFFLTDQYLSGLPD